MHPRRSSFNLVLIRHGVTCSPAPGPWVRAIGRILPAGQSGRARVQVKHLAILVLDICWYSVVCLLFVVVMLNSFRRAYQQFISQVFSFVDCVSCHCGNVGRVCVFVNICA